MKFICTKDECEWRKDGFCIRMICPYNKRYKGVVREVERHAKQA